MNFLNFEPPGWSGKGEENFLLFLGASNIDVEKTKTRSSLYRQNTNLTGLSKENAYLNFA